MNIIDWYIPIIFRPPWQLTFIHYNTSYQTSLQPNILAPMNFFIIKCNVKFKGDNNVSFHFHLVEGLVISTYQYVQINITVFLKLHTNTSTYKHTDLGLCLVFKLISSFAQCAQLIKVHMTPRYDCSGWLWDILHGKNAHRYIYINHSTWACGITDELSFVCAIFYVGDLFFDKGVM